MHDAVRQFVATAWKAFALGGDVIEFGSRDVNGTVRDLITCDSYTGVDTAPGGNVDIVANAADYTPDGLVDVVLCLEVLEHTCVAPEIIENAGRILKPGGVFLFTCATDPREPHSAHDGGPLRGVEFYRNLSPTDIAPSWGFVAVLEQDNSAGDLRGVVIRHGDN